MGKGVKTFNANLSEKIVFKENAVVLESQKLSRLMNVNSYRWSIPCPACHHGNSMPIPFTEIIDGFDKDTGIDHLE